MTRHGSWRHVQDNAIRIGLEPQQGSFLVGLIGISNTVARLVLGAVSQKLNRSVTQHVQIDSDEKRTFIIKCTFLCPHTLTLLHKLRVVLVTLQEVVVMSSQMTMTAAARCSLLSPDAQKQTGSHIVRSCPLRSTPRHASVRKAAPTRPQKSDNKIASLGHGQGPAPF